MPLKNYASMRFNSNFLTTSCDTLIVNRAKQPFPLMMSNMVTYSPCLFSWKERVTRTSWREDGIFRTIHFVIFTLTLRIFVRYMRGLGKKSYTYIDLYIYIYFSIYIYIYIYIYIHIIKITMIKPEEKKGIVIVDQCWKGNFTDTFVSKVFLKSNRLTKLLPNKQQLCCSEGAK